MRFTIVYASATGHTEDIAERLKVLLPGSELKDLDRIDFTKELEESELTPPLKHRSQCFSSVPKACINPLWQAIPTFA